MAILKEIEQGHADVGTFLPLAFLGGLVCAILGVKLGWFKARLDFNDDSGISSVQPVQAVYRSYGIEVYNPSYRESDRYQQLNSTPNHVSNIKPIDLEVIDERPKKPVSVHQPAQSTSSGPKIEEVKKEKSKLSFFSRKDDVKKEKPQTSTSGGEEKDKAKTEEKQKFKLIPLKGEKSEKPKKEKDASPKKSKEEKPKTSKAPKVEKPKSSKLTKEEKDEIARNAKELKEQKAKEAKLKKEKDKKTKAAKPNKDKADKNKSETVASFSQEPKASKSSAAVKQSTRPLNNPLVAKPSAEVTEDDFSNAWDMVSAHRQNLQKSARTEPASNNLRAIANQQKNEPAKKGLFVPNKNSVRGDAVKAPPPSYEENSDEYDV